MPAIYAIRYLHDAARTNDPRPLRFTLLPLRRRDSLGRYDPVAAGLAIGTPHLHLGSRNRRDAEGAERSALVTNRPHALAEALVAGIAPACEYHRDEPRALTDAAQRIHRRFLPTNDEIGEVARLLSERFGVNIASLLALDMAASAHTLRVTQQAFTSRMLTVIAHVLSDAKEAWIDRASKRGL